MPAQNPRTKSSRRGASGGGSTRLSGSASSSRGTLAEVVTTEAAVKRALAPLAREGSARGVELICEIAPAVGRYVLGGRRHLSELVASAAAEGLAACTRGEVFVRLARQHAGFAPTETVLVSVSIQHGGVIRDIVCIDVFLQPADDEEPDEASVFAGKRVLVVVPTASGARVQASASERFGASVEQAHDGTSATRQCRDAQGEGQPFDALYVDESAPGAEALLSAARDDASFGAPHRIVASALDDASSWMARGAESILSKPVLPLELCDALVASRDDVEDAAISAAQAVTRAPPSTGRRVSGVRSLDLAALLAAVAVAPGRGGR